MRSQAWAPGHATFFFAVPQQHENYLQMGSLGGGLNFTAGVKTSVELTDQDWIKWNDKNIDGSVSRTALKLFRKETNKQNKVGISHYSELEIGFGLSTSGAGAISLLLALNHLFETGIQKTKLYQMAHTAEIINKTGLGSVMGQITSGIELRTKQGGPGVGKTLKYNDNSKIVILMIGPLNTSDVLLSKEQMIMVTKSGMNAVKKAKILDNDILENYFAIGKNFMETCGLETDKLKNYISKLNEIGEKQVVMAQIGETLIIKPNNPDKLIKWTHRHKIKTCVTEITNTEPYVINQK